MKIFIKNSIFLLLFLVSALSISCWDNSTNPVTNTGGIRGRILDSKGNPISGVNIYCLFNYGYFPVDTNNFPRKISTIADSVFSFNLYPSYPNPFYNNIFLRFSLAEQASVNISIQNSSGNTIYNYKDSLNYGLYQKFIPDLVKNNLLQNGVYKVLFSVIGKDLKVFSASQNILVISNLGSPNTVSDTKGNYNFNYNQAFVGDSLCLTQSGDIQIVPNITLTSFVNLYFEKDGYAQYQIQFNLFPNFYLNQDIVLSKLNIYPQ